MWLMPRNPSYDPVPGNDVRILGKAVGVLRLLQTGGNPLEIDLVAMPSCRYQRGVAQMARAPVSKTGCRRFDSCRPCH